jgi:hypothetical protein
MIMSSTGACDTVSSFFFGFAVMSRTDNVAQSQDCSALGLRPLETPLETEGCACYEDAQRALCGPMGERPTMSIKTPQPKAPPPCGEGLGWGAVSLTEIVSS